MRHLLRCLPVQLSPKFCLNAILLKDSCTTVTGLAQSAYSVDFTKGSDLNNWRIVSGNVSYTSAGAEFTINKQGDGPGLETPWFFLFGRLEVKLKAASGVGIASTVTLESDDFDEVTWEWLGGKTSEVLTSYSANKDANAAHSVSAPQSTSHTYAIDWSKEAISWFIDGALIRTVNAADVSRGGSFPQTPMRVSLDIWAPGDPRNSQGSIDFAGGVVDYKKGPFTFTVESVSVTNANPAASYTYGDQ
ncbi:extracellular cell wall glucanase crf1 allergen asp f9 [Colletotrichum truncatum]|uniref:Extracellular cell wall glucanase crf1 allergen asp f9 n=1 Tax=Colletotrichum truncatum TaxID=5467 RepID=A0ACC3Z3F1_COLTU|nr:extracellular cell wall glucanase crf1 allergen asp f9 [Colletotrichum truncatum]KAF6793098.1 extracellular cell wall glucanase crf1 allergen asp f9 [Colletotrichum truncatum]